MNYTSIDSQQPERWQNCQVFSPEHNEVFPAFFEPVNGLLTYGYFTVGLYRAGSIELQSDIVIWATKNALKPVLWLPVHMPEISGNVSQIKESRHDFKQTGKQKKAGEGDTNILSGP